MRVGKTPILAGRPLPVKTQLGSKSVSRRNPQCEQVVEYTLGVRAGLTSFVAAGVAISIEAASDIATRGYREFLADYFAGLIVIGIVSVPTSVCFLLRRSLLKREWIARDCRDFHAREPDRSSLSSLT